MVSKEDAKAHMLGKYAGAIYRADQCRQNIDRAARRVSELSDELAQAVLELNDAREADSKARAEMHAIVMEAL